MNCLGFLEKLKVIPTENDPVETADCRFFLKPFLVVHRHKNGWKRKKLTKKKKKEGFSNVSKPRHLIY